MHPLFSVIIPTYNRPASLLRALTSVQQQTYTNWEVIVVDDGSSRAVALSPNTDPRIRVYQQANAGPAAARRLGLVHTLGDVVCFLDDDDYYLSNHLEVLKTAYLQRSGLYAVGLVAEDANGRQTRVPLYPHGRITLGDYWARPIGLYSFGFPIGLIRRMQPVDAPAIEDFTWMVRLLASEEAHQLPNYTAVFVTHQANRTTSQLHRDDLLAREMVLRDAYAQPAIKSRISKSAYHKLLTHQRLHWTRQCLRAAQWKDALYGLSRSFKSIGRASIYEYAYTLLIACRVCLKALRTDLHSSSD